MIHLPVLYHPADEPVLMSTAGCPQGQLLLSIGARCPWNLPGGVCPQFRCDRCGQWVPWCQGASDDYPLWCDDCWSVAAQAQPAGAAA